MKLSRRWALLAVFVFAGAAGFAWFRRGTCPSPEKMARAVRQALDQNRPDEARRIAAEAVARYPASAAVLTAAADIDFQQGRLEDALSRLEQVEDDGTAAALDAVGAAGDILFRLNRLSEAESRFRRVLTRNPDNLPGRQRLALLLALSGRRTAAAQVWFEIIKRGDFDTHDLALLGQPEQVFDNPEFVKLYQDAEPGDPSVRLGAAFYALYRHEPSKALTLFRKLAAKLTDDADVRAGLGQALLEAGTAEEFIRWHADLPASAEGEAEIWNIRGRFAQLRGENDVAIRCYWEAVRRDPNRMQSNNQLAVLLHQRGDDTVAGAVRRRADLLQSLGDMLGSILVDDTHVRQLQRTAELAEDLGRFWEARGWYQAASARSGRDDFRAQVERLSGMISSETPQTLPAANPALRVDLSYLPSPAWVPADASAGQVPVSRGSRWLNQVTFRDLAPASGIDFTYFNGDDPEEAGIRIFESSGGGVAALDYDGDGWPDLYFTQGTEWPPQPEQTRHLDRLFRNRGDGRFADVTSASGLGDERYSQGVAVGDFDDDGFADLYVANIGQNRLYRNNGDGTFTDQTVAARLRGGGWTTSALMADLNGDGFPEIYDVTYVAGNEPFEHVCHDPLVKDAPRICSPKVFAAQPDRLYLNRGDGTFEDVSSRAGIEAPDGKGLGIAAGDFDGSGRLSLYVANDTTPNFLFLNQTAHAGDVPVFMERAALAGCAVDSEGKPHASMGIAVDDADGDGLVDLVVTSFYNEFDVLYRQLPGGLFMEASSAARLKEPSRSRLGFGTQFLDGDLDGWPDLVVANGNVDDFRELGIPFRMRAQYFANLGEAQFVELPPGQLGDYFQREQLGRSVARLDWNRDGREDFAVSNLDTPASLVTNQSPETGHFLALQLRGVESSRDAIGAMLVARSGGRQLVRQLTAGDGYQAGNQRQIVFGLADETSLDELTVRWPSGRRQTFSHVPGDAEYLVIEGRPELVRLGR